MERNSRTLRVVADEHALRDRLGLVVGQGVAESSGGQSSDVSTPKLRIALVAPPLLPVPPIRYGGLERIVAVIADGLVARGHDVTLFAPCDSTFAGTVVATVPSGLWN